jgi:hypothetical protein
LAVLVTPQLVCSRHASLQYILRLHDLLGMQQQQQQQQAAAVMLNLAQQQQQQQVRLPLAAVAAVPAAPLMQHPSSTRSNNSSSSSREFAHHLARLLGALAVLQVSTSTAAAMRCMVSC